MTADMSKMTPMPTRAFLAVRQYGYPLNHYVPLFIRMCFTDSKC